MEVKIASVRPPCWYGDSAEKRAKGLPFYWSASRQNLIEVCPNCYRRKYIYKEAEDPTKEREKKQIYGYGSVVHEAVEDVRAGKPMPTDVEIAARAGVQHIDDVKTHVELLLDKLNVLGLGSAMSEAHFLCHLKHPEKDESLDIPMYGIFDLSQLEISGADRTMRIADIKSGSQKWSRSKCMNHYQFKGYSYVGWAITGKIPMFDVISLIRSDHKNGKDAKVENQPVDFTMKDLVDFYESTDIAMRLHKQMVAGEWIEQPCVKHFFMCPKFIGG